MLKEKVVLIPEYIKEFSCIGGSCEDSCCKGWYISIDEDTYKKYRKVTDYRIKGKIERDIARTRSNKSKNNTAKMKLKDGKCTFLNENELCDIHGILGEEYLCNTCKTYPRSINSLNITIEKSLTLSCPEAARKILLNREKLEFEQKIEMVKDDELYNKTLSYNEEMKMKLKDYFWNLRIFTIDLLQNRNYSLEERLIILGLFYNNIKSLEGERKVNEVEGLIEKYVGYIECGVFKEELVTIPNAIDIQVKLCKELVDLRFKSGISSERYLECLRKALIGLNFKEGMEIEDNKKGYLENYNLYYKEFFKDKEYILENYLVNYVFKNLMPFDEGDVFESYGKMIIHYALIKLHLVGISGFDKGLSEESVVELIQSISRTFEHSNTYLKKIMKLLKESDYMNLGSMAILIKN